MALDPTTGTRNRRATPAERKRARAALRRREAERRRDAARQSEAKDKRLAKHLDDPVVRATAAGKFRPLPGSLPPETEKKLQAAGLMPTRGGGLVFKTAENLAEAAVNTPAGLFEVGKAGAFDLRDTVRGKPTVKRSRKVADAVVASTVETVRHPLRRPGDTLLLGWGAVGAGAGAASRVSAVGRHVRKGNVGKALVGKPHEGGSLLRAPQPRERVLKHGDLKVRAPESRNKAVAAVTRQLDKRPGGQASPRRVGQELSEELRITEALERAPMLALANRAKKLTKAQQTAVRVIAEEAPLAERIRYHQERAAGGKGQTRRDHRYQAMLLQAATRYVKDGPDGKPAFRDDFKGTRVGKGVGSAELKSIYEDAGKVADDRAATLKALGLLSDESEAARISGPGREIAGQTLRAPDEPSPPTPGQLSLIEPNPDERFSGGAFRVPYTRTQPPRAHEGAAQFRGGTPRKPGSVTHEFKAGLLKSGGFRPDAVKQIAESGVEAQRYAGAVRLRDRLLEGAKDEPFDNAVPIKTDDLVNKPYPPQVARILQKAEDGQPLSRNEKRYLGSQFDEIVRELGLDPDREITAVKGVKWIDRRVLKELHRQGAPLRALLGNRTTDTIDAINNFSRLAIFYTKPGYIPPNVIGNALLNFNQQGFSSIPNLAATGSWARKLGDDVAKVDAVMGEGVIGSLGGGNKGAPLAAEANFAAGKLSLITDRRFRRNAFRHEARQAGFRTAAQVKDLLTNPARRGDLVEVAKRANREVIDYGRLTKNESEIHRRLLFVYPFLKGSAIYTGRFVKEHPVKAAAMAQLAQVGKEEADRELGPRPSYAEGLVSLGEGRAMNLAGAGLFNAPAQVAKTIGDAATGRDRSGFKLSEMLTPAAGLVLAIASGRDSFTGRALKGPRDTIQTSLLNSLPQKQLYDRLTRPEGGEDNRVYPYSDRDALLQFGLGSIAPRPVNREALNQQAREEQASDLSPTEREFRKVFDDRRQTHEAFKKHGLKLEDGRLPKALRQSFNVKAERFAGYARVGHEPTQLDRYLSDMRVFVKLGVATPEQATEGVRWARGATSAEIEALRNTWSTRRDGAWRKLYLDNFAYAREAIEDSGGDASFLRSSG